jgi:hypothetical protein
VAPEPAPAAARCSPIRRRQILKDPRHLRASSSTGSDARSCSTSYSTRPLTPLERIFRPPNPFNPDDVFEPSRAWRPTEMSMNSPVRKKLLSLFGIGILNGFAGLLGGMFIHPSLLVAGFAIAAVCGGLMNAVKCPRCGTPAMRKTIQLLGVNWNVWGGVVPSRCRTCGESFY